MEVAMRIPRHGRREGRWRHRTLFPHDRHNEIAGRMFDMGELKHGKSPLIKIAKPRRRGGQFGSVLQASCAPGAPAERLASRVCSRPEFFGRPGSGIARARALLGDNPRPCFLIGPPESRARTNETRRARRLRGRNGTPWCGGPVHVYTRQHASDRPRLVRHNAASAPPTMRSMNSRD